MAQWAMALWVTMTMMIATGKHDDYNDGDGAMGDKVEDDGDGATGDGATEYNYVDDCNEQRR